MIRKTKSGGNVKMFSFQIEEATERKIRKLKAKYGVQFSFLFRQAITEYMERHYTDMAIN